MARWPGWVSGRRGGVGRGVLETEGRGEQCCSGVGRSTGGGLRAEGVGPVWPECGMEKGWGSFDQVALSPPQAGSGESGVVCYKDAGSGLEPQAPGAGIPLGQEHRKLKKFFFKDEEKDWSL